MERRTLLKSLAAIGVFPYAASADEQSARIVGGQRLDLGLDSSARTLVLLELKGGNDALNTVVPFADVNYRRKRPKLALERDSVLALDERLGLHSALAPLMRIWDNGDLAVVNGLGYPSPNRSHFRSNDIWETGSGAEEVRADGWLAPVLANLRSIGDGPKAVVLDMDAGPVTGDPTDIVVMDDLSQFIEQAKMLSPAHATSTNPAYAYIQDVESSARLAALSFEKKLSRAKNGEARLELAGRTELENKLTLVAAMINADLGPRVYKVTLKGFDTHIAQARKHERLLAELAAGISTLEQLLRVSGRWRDTLLMTYSEFGRRLAENASGGTDHGTAASHFVVGGRVSGGLHGESPRFDNVTDGDLEFTVDFRSMYRTAVRDWFELDLADASFSNFDSLGLLR